MKLVENHKSNIDITGNNFTIKPNAKAFKILSDGLYSNKILAVVRELSSNAWDIHITKARLENTEPTTPFDVTIPKRSNSVFSIRDYGTGLSPDEVEQVYTTYFESTKTDSNDTTGALGLGSKSPFCLVDEFIVESFYQGVCYEYCAFYGTNGFPQITLIDQSQTQEPDGLRVTFEKDWSSNDRYEFQKSAVDVYRWFPVKPNINIDLEPTFLESCNEQEIFSESNASIIERLNENVYVKQGTVAYPVYLSDLEAMKLDHHLITKMRKTVVFEVPLGSVDITASRENLSYVDITQKTITQAVELAEKEFRAHLLNMVPTAGNCLWKLLDLINKTKEKYTGGFGNRDLSEFITNEFKNEFVKLNKLTSVNDLTIDYSQLYYNESIKVTLLEKYNSKLRKATGWNFSNYQKTSTINFSELNTVMFFLNDYTFGYQNRIRYARNLRSKNIVAIDPVNRKDFDFTEVEKILADIGLPSHRIIRSSELDTYIPKPASAGPKVVIPTGYKFSWNGASKVKLDGIGKDSAVYYVDYTRSKINTQNGMPVDKEACSVSDFVTVLTRYHETISEKNLVIIGLTKSQKQLAKKHNIETPCVYEYIDRMIADINSKYDLVQKRVDCMLSCSNSEPFLKMLVTCDDPELNKLGFKALSINEANNESKKLPLSYISDILNVAQVVLTDNKLVTEMIDRKHECEIVDINAYMKQHYPVSCLFGSQYYGIESQVLDALKEMFNLVYNKNLKYR